MRMASVGSWLVVSLALVGGTASAETARGVVFVDRDLDGVRDAGEPGVAGVAVSNGLDVVVTDAEGRYAIEVEPDVVLFISKPADHALPPGDDGMPRFYYRHYPKGSRVRLRFPGVDPTGALPESIDFPLIASDEPRAFRVLCFADTQPQNHEELSFLRDDVLSEVLDLDVAFGVVAGDILYDDLALFPRYISLMARVGIPWFHVPGNHELNFMAESHAHARDTYVRHLGPAYYSFDYADVHFVTLDTVHYHGAKQKRNRNGRSGGSYEGRIGKRQIEWLRADLERVPEDRLVVLLMHIPLASYLDPEEASVNVADRRELFALLAGREHLLALAGHLHLSEHHYFGAEDGFEGPGELHLHSLPTASGSWWSGPIDERGVPTTWQRDGTPNGYGILHIDGSEARVEFRAAGRAPTEQMRIALDALYHGQSGNNQLYQRQGASLAGPIDLAQLASTDVLVNLYDGGPSSRLTLRIDGGEPVVMERTVREDPFIVELFTRHRDAVKHFVNPLPSQHLWRAPLPANLEPGAHLIEVTAIDEYGQRHRGTRIFEVIAR